MWPACAGGVNLRVLQYPYETARDRVMTVGIIDMIAGTALHADVSRVPTVSTTYLQGVIDYALTRGVSHRALLMHAGISETELLRVDARHPIERLFAILDAGAALAGDAAFALHFGRYVPCEQVSLAAPLGRSAATVTEALVMVNRYAPLGIDLPGCPNGNRFAFESDRAGLWLCDSRPADAWAPLTELVFSRMVQGIRRIQQSDVVRAVYVRHAAPAHRDAYDDVFGVPVHFQSGRNAILLDKSYLDTPLTPQPAHVTRILAAHADTQLATLDRSRSCRARLESELRALLHTGDVGVESLARRMAMSRQTLYRRLKAEGTTYEQVLEELRRAIALEALGTGDASVRALAARLGFAETAAFSRAFKRWTGKSPSLLRGTVTASPLPSASPQSDPRSRASTAPLATSGHSAEVRRVPRSHPGAA